MAIKNLHILVLLREVSDPRPPARVITRGAGISDRGLRRIPNPADLVALELHAAADALGILVGRDVPDDLLGRVFARFCVGK